MTKELNTDARVTKSTRVYDSPALNGYDLFVHGFCNRYAWKCSTQTLVDQYKRLTSTNHLEAGVGTGFLIDKSAIQPNGQRLGILDFSKQCLSYSEKRLSRYSPELFHFDILKPISSSAAKFDSIGLNYVLHCVPGSFETKGVAFANLKALLSQNGVMFGSTLLGDGVPRNLTAKMLMSFYNQTGIFNNIEDSQYALRRSLEKTFDRIDIEVVGCCALFEVS